VNGGAVTEGQADSTSARTPETRPTSEAPAFEARPPRWLLPIRRRVHRLPAGATAWKLLIAAVGLAIVVVGLLLIPLPGPGWAIVFLGLAAWATEFYWAHRLLARARRILRRWTGWAARQPLMIRVLLAVAGIVVLITMLSLGLFLLG
jgi:uncharacterized protein (TIGR02611 family)